MASREHLEEAATPADADPSSSTHGPTRPPTDHPAADDVDATELVGPGRYPLRLQPAAALLPGTGDPARLLTVWYARKSFYWLFFLGWAFGSLGAFWSSGDIEFDVNFASPDSVRQALLSPWAALLLALFVRFVNGWLALALAFPLAIGHETGLGERTNSGRIGRFFDRLHLARAFRAVRWTYAVRQIALDRLGPTGRRLAKLDPVIDVVNVLSGVTAFVVLIYISTQIST